MTLHALADRLHMSIARLEAEMSLEEVIDWIAFYKIRDKK